MRKSILFVLMAVSLFVSADDVMEVKNGKTPRGAKYTLKLTEDLRFGGEDDGEEYLWPGLNVQVEANGNGEMFVVDPINKRLLLFDKTGKYIKTVGGPGEGPGEFQILQTFQVLADGRGLAFGVAGPTASMSWFNPDMTFKDRSNNANLGGIIQSIRFAPSGKLSARGMLKIDFSQPHMTTTYSLNAGEEEIHALGSVDTMNVNPNKMADPAWWTDFMASQFEPYAKGQFVFWEFDNNDNFYVARGGTYEVTRYDSAGNKTMVFGRDYDRTAWLEEDIKELIYPIQEAMTSALPPQLQEIVSENVIRNAIDKADLPQIQHPVQGIKVMEDGKVLVIHTTSLTARESSADLFSKEGKYLGSYTHKNMGLLRMVFKNGYAYTMETDADENNTFVRYKVDVVQTR